MASIRNAVVLFLVITAAIALLGGADAKKNKRRAKKNVPIAAPSDFDDVDAVLAADRNANLKAEQAKQAQYAQQAQANKLVEPSQVHQAQQVQSANNNNNKVQSKPVSEVDVQVKVQAQVPKQEDKPKEKLTWSPECLSCRRGMSQPIRACVAEMCPRPNYAQPNLDVEKAKQARKKCALKCIKRSCGCCPNKNQGCPIFEQFVTPASA